MAQQKLIPAPLYEKIIGLVPILTVDIIVRYKGRYVLVLRKNEPLKGVYWVIGGRALKDETVQRAAKRKLYEELGVNVEYAQPIGFYEDSYPKSAFGVPTHTFSVVFEVTIKKQPVLDWTSSDWELSGELPYRFLRKLYRFNV